MGAVGVDAAAGLVSDPSELQQISEKARAEGAFGFDTEFMREKTYRAKLCLAQIAVGEQIWLIDPLEKTDLRPIADLIADPEVETVVHAGGQDFEIFYDLYEVVPQRVFDVQLAAAFAGYGASLPYGRLVQEATGVSLVKGESYTDWCRRPLSDSQLRYAADDVRYLVAISQRLRSELNEMGRESWVTEEMRSFEDETTYRFAPLEAWRRVGGRGTLKPKQLTVLRRLAAWREESASKRDLPRGWVMKDATLVDVARRAPRSQSELNNVRGLNGREVERSGRAILQAVAQGLEDEPLERTPSPPRQVQQRARMVSGLADAIVRARADHAGIATEFVATRGELEALLADVFSGTLDESRHRLMHGWRREIAGDAVVALVTGKLAIRVTDKSPFVEEVEL